MKGILHITLFHNYRNIIIRQYKIPELLMSAVENHWGYKYGTYYASTLSILEGLTNEN